MIRAARAAVNRGRVTVDREPMTGTGVGEKKSYPARIRTAPASAEETVLLEQGGAESGALPPDLAALVAAWSNLPDHIRAAIRALVTTAAG